MSPLSFEIGFIGERNTLEFPAKTAFAIISDLNNVTELFLSDLVCHSVTPVIVRP